ncbi:TPA: hypothetical protein L4S58_004577 [Pseudomonas aeruginosa]|nr:hypothetical protein [Pseudomonas aeruginosa]
MRDLKHIHTQDLSDLFNSFMNCFDERRNSILLEMFKSQFGALFCEPGAIFNETYQAYGDNKHRVPIVMAEVAEELERRDIELRAA